MYIPNSKRPLTFSSIGVNEVLQLASKPACRLARRGFNFKYSGITQKIQTVQRAVEFSCWCLLHSTSTGMYAAERVIICARCKDKRNGQRILEKNDQTV